VSHPSERRASPRCDAVENHSTLHCSVPDGSRRIEARLVNISRGGALIVADKRPPYEPPMWLRIESPVKTDWVETTIVRLGRNREIGLQFPRGCLDDLLLAGTIGIDLTTMISDGTTRTSTCD